ncbi:MAG TPA: chorismate synthase [Fibrobacteria bacterium]|nr:chorismate synthase [Fibrobacteria bacterium]
MGNVLGRILRLSTFGESHGPAVGCIVDGLPSGLPVVVADIQRDLDRRRPGQNKLTTQRKEEDRVEILSGVFQGCATGTPLAMLVHNTDQRSGDYSEMENLYRPSHADLAYDLKFGFRDHRGGGRSSVRESIARVAAGALAKRLLREVAGTRILAWVESVETVDAHVDPDSVTEEAIEASLVRCPDPEASKAMEAAILRARGDGDSVGGVVRLRVDSPPVGIGEPVFDRLEAELAKAMLSIPATKGFEIGSGFAGSRLRGSIHNDPLAVREGRPVLTKNDSGGIQGGISVGAPIDARIAFKPTATIASPQKTLDRDYHEATLAARGRHDPCVVARAVPIVEAMAALVLADAFLLQRSRGGLFPPPEPEDLA